MAKKVKVDYRKICKEHYGYTNDQMEGMDVHHIDGNRDNNHPFNLQLVTPKQHAEIHKHEFILWSRKGSKLGNKSLKKRMKELGPTEKELANWNRLSQLAKTGLHKTPHTKETKKIISEKKKELLKDKSNHPMWGRTTYELISPTGEIHIVSDGWKEWCLSRGLNPSNLTKVAKGERKHCKGWKAKILNE